VENVRKNGRIDSHTQKSETVKTKRACKYLFTTGSKGMCSSSSMWPRDIVSTAFKISVSSASFAGSFHLEASAAYLRFKVRK